MRTARARDGGALSTHRDRVFRPDGLFKREKQRKLQVMHVGTSGSGRAQGQNMKVMSGLRKLSLA